MAESTIGEQELGCAAHRRPRWDHCRRGCGRVRSASRACPIDGVDDDGTAASEGAPRPQIEQRRVPLWARSTSADLLKGAIQRFVERNLDGSVSPFLAYLSEADELTDGEVRELERLVGRLHAKRKKDR